MTDDIECPYCHGMGWEFAPDGGQGIARKCRQGCYEKMLMDNRLSFANIPEAFKDMRLDGFNTNIYKNAKSRSMAETASKAVRFWLEDFESMDSRGMGLYLHSETKGSGKTRMAAGIANELIHKNHIQVKFATSLQILSEIKASWDKQGSERSEGELLHFLSTARVLIIDDFGVEQAEKDWIREKFYQIINSRYIDKKITIFTSNIQLDVLQYDDRITNRIKERAFQIPFPEESVRDIIARRNMGELIRGIKGST